MRKKAILIALCFYAMTVLSQEVVTKNVIIPNDSIYEMSRVNGRQQVLITAPEAGKSIIVQSIVVSNEVHNRLYSPDSGSCEYLIGYQNGSYWYQLATLPFDQLNMTGWTTLFYTATGFMNVWDAGKISGAPLVIKLSSPVGFTDGFNKLTIRLTYCILN